MAKGLYLDTLICMFPVQTHAMNFLHKIPKMWIIFRIFTLQCF